MGPRRTKPDADAARTTPRTRAKRRRETSAGGVGATRRAFESDDDDEDDEDDEDDDDEDDDEDDVRSSARDAIDAEEWYASLARGDADHYSFHILGLKGLSAAHGTKFIGHASASFSMEGDMDRPEEVADLDEDEDDGIWNTIMKGFHDGDPESILRECRDEDNVPYDAQTISGMMDGLMEHGKTIHAPFCFTRGAVGLKHAIYNHVHEARTVALELDSWWNLHESYNKSSGMLDERGDDVTAMYAECEIGVYISRAGGDIAEWHTDRNDNFTIQLKGSKLWEVERVGRTYTGSMTSNASLAVEPSCGVDYLTRDHGDFGPFARNINASKSTSAYTNTNDRSVPERYMIREGECFGTRAGQYHRVTPVGGGLSISVNIRLTPYQSNVWKSEVYFLRLSATGARAKGVAKFTPEDELALRPRFGPFDARYSDGLVLGCWAQSPLSIGDIREWDTSEGYTALYMNPMCACSTSITAEGFVLNIKCTSPLTNKEYMNEFNVYVTGYAYKLDEIFSSPMAFNRWVSRGAPTNETKWGTWSSDVRELFNQVISRLVHMHVVINTKRVSKGCALFLKTFYGDD